jgi:ankyrin repeat protein
MKHHVRTTGLLLLLVATTLLVANCAASPTAVPDPGEALSEAILAGDLAEVDRLLEAGIDANGESPFGPVIVLAAAEGNADAVRLLAEHGADVGAQAASGRTPLTEAALKGHVAVIEQLLDQGADIDRSDATTNRWAALAAAASEGHLPVVELLIARDADVNQTDGTGSAALHWAAASGNPGVGQLLIDAGADIDLQDGHGNPPLTCVSLGRGSPDFAQLLVNEGASLNLVNSEGLTPLGEAEKRGWEEVSEVLRTAGAEP